MFTASANTTLTNTALMSQSGSSPAFNRGDRCLDGEFIVSAVDIQKIVEASVGAYQAKLMQEVDNKIQNFLTEIKLAISQRAQNTVPAPPSLTSIQTVYGTLPKPQAPPFVYQPPFPTTSSEPVSHQPSPAATVIIKDSNNRRSQYVESEIFPHSQNVYSSQPSLTQQPNSWPYTQQPVHAQSLQQPVIATENQNQHVNQQQHLDYQLQCSILQPEYPPKATSIPVFQPPPDPPESYSIDPSWQAQNPHLCEYELAKQGLKLYLTEQNTKNTILRTSIPDTSSVLMQSALFNWKGTVLGSRYKWDRKRKKLMDSKLNSIQKSRRKELKRLNIRVILQKACVKHKKSCHTRFRFFKFDI